MALLSKVIADSEYLDRGKSRRITTLELFYPTQILAEFNTHRVFSRNARSQRATPIQNLIDEVKTYPFIPVVKGNQKGMSASEEVVKGADAIWLEARDCAVDYADILMKRGAHKQYANRLLTPFMYTRALVTSTEWENFFRQRISKLAEPSMQELASDIQQSIRMSTPDLLSPGVGFHLPYISYAEKNQLTREHGEGEALAYCVRASVARCARVSVKPFDMNTIDLGADMRLYHKLITANPPHLSPFEHVAFAPTKLQHLKQVFRAIGQVWNHRGTDLLYGNFKGWFQLRKVMENASDQLSVLGYVSISAPDFNNTQRPDTNSQP